MSPAGDPATLSRSICLIVAMDDNRLIGRNGGLPWRLPDDLKRFKALTLGKTVLMGRRTWDSLYVQPLPGRANWVVSRDPAFRPAGATVFPSIDAALAAHREGELMVIGGELVYRQLLPFADRIQLTRVHARLEGGDAWFPEIDPEQWRETGREPHAADARHALAFEFVQLDRK